MTTIKELYEWAVKNNAESLPVGIQFQDGGGSYSGDTFTKLPDYRISAFVEEYRGEKYILLE